MCGISHAHFISFTGATARTCASLFLAFTAYLIWKVAWNCIVFATCAKIIWCTPLAVTTITLVGSWSIAASAYMCFGSAVASASLTLTIGQTRHGVRKQEEDDRAHHNGYVKAEEPKIRRRNI